MSKVGPESIPTPKLTDFCFNMFTGCELIPESNGLITLRKLVREVTESENCSERY